MITRLVASGSNLRPESGRMWPVQARPLYSFGPFQLDEGLRRPARDSEPVALSDRQIDILLLLVTRSGRIVSKDALIEAAWRDVAVGDNSLEQAISALRRILKDAPDGSPYIETLARRGYRFRAPVNRTVARVSDQVLDSLLGPHRGFVEGRAALETLTLDAVVRARQAFGNVVGTSPDYAPGHIGLANALTLVFESTRAGDAPDVQAIVAAGTHAREACRLDPASGEAWATLSFVLSRTGADAEATAAARRAIELEPDNWRHRLRAAYVTWGEDRLRAAHRTLQLLPGLGLAHWLAASVHVARQALDEAERELVLGTEAQDRQIDGARFSAVGLHLLLGLVRLARGDEAAAESEFARELTFERAGHVYTNQACANTWCALGAIRLKHAEGAEANDAFARALEIVPGHLMALAALSTFAAPERRASAEEQLAQRLAFLRAHGATVEAALVESAGKALAGRHTEAARIVRAVLKTAPPGSSAGWTLPVEPLLQANSHLDEWTDVLTRLRARAA